MASETLLVTGVTAVCTLLLALILWFALSMVAEPTDSRSTATDDADEEPIDAAEVKKPPLESSGLQASDVLNCSALVEIVFDFLETTARWRASAVSHVWREASRGGVASMAAIGSDDVRSLSTVLSARHAEGLELVGRACRQLSSDALLRLLAQLPSSVRILRLARCSALGEEAGLGTLTGRPLVELDVSLTAASDGVLAALLRQSGRSLRHLTLSHTQVSGLLSGISSGI